MVDSVGLFAHTEFCNLVGYPFLLFSFFFFLQEQEDKYTKLPLSFKLFNEGQLLSCKWLVTRANCFFRINRVSYCLI